MLILKETFFLYSWWEPAWSRKWVCLSLFLETIWPVSCWPVPKAVQTTKVFPWYCLKCRKISQFPVVVVVFSFIFTWENFDRLNFMLKGKYDLLFHLVYCLLYYYKLTEEVFSIFYLIDILKTSSIFSMWIRKYTRVRYEMGAIWIKVFKSNFIFLDSSVDSFLTLIRMNFNASTVQLNLHETDLLFRYLSHHLTWHCLLIYGFSPVFPSSCLLWS